MRMNDAMRMLQGTDLPINTISDMLGFANPNYFSNVFLKETGCSPSEFRQKSKK